MAAPRGVSPAWRGVQGIGLALHVAGLAAFLALPFAGKYDLDAEAAAAAVERAGLDERGRAALVTELGQLRGTTHASAVGFQRGVAAAIEAAERALGDGPQIDDYQRGLVRYEVGAAALRGPVARHPLAWLLGTVGLACLGALALFLPRLATTLPGIGNDGVTFSSVKARGSFGIALGVLLIGFYVALYFRPEYIVEWIRITDPLSRALRGEPAGRWFFYGFLYTLAIAVMGVRMLVHYRHSRYHLVRTTSVIFFQTVFAFTIPSVLAALNRPEVDLKNAWPLDYSFFFGYRLDEYTSGPAFGWFVLLWGLALAFVLVPVLAWLVGKRWYCSWVCGCGGLAETLGDPFRHLSNKSLRAWRIERWLVHGVLVFAVVMTAIVVVNYFTGWLGSWTYTAQSWYGLAIGAIFAGVVGVGFYPFMGSRVWCRFGCPLAAILGMVQRFKSRFRITTNGGQCISCGNCSTYCEMGIDVRWYAQRGQNIIRSSCVGCGICAAVCPRGVLRLENGPEEGRFATSPLVLTGPDR